MNEKTLEERIAEIKSNNNGPGDNSKERVADAMTAIVNAIPDVVSEIGDDETKAVSQKAWTEKNQEIRESLSTHTTSNGVHFDKPATMNQHLDDYKSEGVYRIKGNARADNGLGTYEDAILIVSMIEYAILQVRVTGARYQRRMFDLGAWKDWEDVIPEADKYTPGLMSIDHYKSVENMITNFEGLVQSQTEIKEALEGVKNALQQESDWDTSVILTTLAQPEGFREWRKPMITFNSGTDKETKVLYKDGAEFRLKGEEISHGIPIELKDTENRFVAYNKNATEITLSFSGGVERIGMLMVNSAKITRVVGNYFFPKEVDVSRCPNLNTLIMGGNSLEAIDLTTNTKLEYLSIGEGPIKKLDLTYNPIIRSIGVRMNSTFSELNISKCQNIKELDFWQSSGLRLSGIVFPETFRPTFMIIADSGFVYEDIINMISDKWTWDLTDSTLVVSKEMVDVIQAGDMTAFQKKNVNFIDSDKFWS